MCAGGWRWGEPEGGDWDDSGVHGLGGTPTKRRVRRFFSCLEEPVGLELPSRPSVMCAGQLCVCVEEGKSRDQESSVGCRYSLKGPQSHGRGCVSSSGATRTVRALGAGFSGGDPAESPLRWVHSTLQGGPHFQRLGNQFLHGSFLHPILLPRLPTAPCLPVHGQPVPFGPAKPSEHLKSPPGACVWGPRSTRQHLAASQAHHLLTQVPASPPPAAASSHRPQADGTLQRVSDPLQEDQGGGFLSYRYSLKE